MVDNGVKIIKNKSIKQILNYAPDFVHYHLFVFSIYNVFSHILYTLRHVYTGNFYVCSHYFQIVCRLVSKTG